jgi:hypothetical protein
VIDDPGDKSLTPLSDVLIGLAVIVMLLIFWRTL